MPDETFLLYSNASEETGEKLAESLDVDGHGKSCDKHIDWLIRWGSTRGVRYIPNEGVINSKSSLEGNVDKLNALDTLKHSEIPVPEFSRDASDLNFPILGRSRNHSQGSDINLLLQPRDVYLTDNTFFVQYYPTKLEYRVHVIDGEVIKVHEKRLRTEEENHPYIRNKESGWVFCEPREEPPDEQICIDAIDALDMDFGALDVIRVDTSAINRGYEYLSLPDHNELILEVNSAPSLDENNLERYTEKLSSVLENRSN